MIKVIALKAEFNYCFKKLSEVYQDCSLDINPIRRNSLYSILLQKYCHIKFSEYKYLNISHSGIWCVCCCGGYPCSIDIEKHRDIVSKQFINRWIMIESYLKYNGTGLNGLSKVDLLNDNNMYYYKFDEIQGYSICVCAKKNIEVEKKLTVIKPYDLCELLL